MKVLNVLVILNSGKLKEGWLADIILVDRSGFHWKPNFNDISIAVYAANSQDVDTVIINGQPLMVHKEMLTIDVGRLNYASKSCSKKIICV